MIYLQAALNLALFALVVYERHQRRTTERRLVQLRRRTGTPTERETALTIERDDLYRRLITSAARQRQAESERDTAVGMLQEMRTAVREKGMVK